MSKPQQTLVRIAAAASQLNAATRGGAPTRRESMVTLGWLVIMAVTTSLRTGQLQVPEAPLLLAVLLTWAPLLLRTYRPGLALIGTLAAESGILTFFTVPEALSRASEGMGAYQPVPLATMLAVYTVAARLPRRAGWAVGVGSGGFLMVVGVAVQSTDTFLTDLVVFYLVVTAAAVGVWQAGRREKQDRIARERDAHAERAVLDERLRIARELHDVLAHNLTLVNAQAGVARYLLRSDLDAAEQALRDITEHTARAIDEVRATIGLLRGVDDAQPRDAQASSLPGLRPVPGLDALDTLIETFRAAGAVVELRTAGVPRPLAQQVDLAAYRILQESLTNAAKHAPGSPVEITVTWGDADVRLRVYTQPPSVSIANEVPGTGNGLIGMRERAIAAGGHLRAGPSNAGGFEVLAVLPTAGNTSAAQRPAGFESARARTEGLR